MLATMWPVIANSRVFLLDTAFQWRRFGYETAAQQQEKIETYLSPLDQATPDRAKLRLADRVTMGDCREGWRPSHVNRGARTETVQFHRITAIMEGTATVLWIEMPQLAVPD
jgi:hypothetical protein